MESKTDFPSTTISSEGDKKSNSNSRRGRGSRKKKEEQWREKVGQKIQNERQEAFRNKYAQGSAIYEALERMAQQPQSRAVPLTVSTRGVGIAASLQYHHMSTTGNIQAIEQICTIYQFTLIYLIESS
ncbi:unnamed protein product [Psylliodes chrysocephalus]|uniref:Uncharacterized protein n=1 Tax=Psylliodes chrysocephalus TaxID=3402493 RepID=A0A9P0DD75_9CUCU|nr:unnamed protein product [Psylliodes chrysocephala]